MLGRLLGRPGGQPEVERLVADLSSESERVRGRAVRGLGRAADPGRVADRRRVAAEPAVLRALERALQDPQPRIRELAVEALGNVPGEGAVCRLVEIVADPGMEELHWEAIRALGAQGAEDELLATYRNPNLSEEVRDWAEHQLRRLARLGVGGRPRRPRDIPSPYVPGSER